MAHMARTHARRMSRTVALGATLVMATAGSTMAGLDTGQLPVAGFSHTSLIDNQPSGFATADSLADIYQELARPSSAEVGPTSRVGVDLSTSGPMAVTTTYTLQPVDPRYRLGWHSTDGPVIFTVATGTLTFVDDTCQTFDLVAGHTYIESTGQVLNALVLPEKNPGVEAVAWLMTRLYPEGAADAVEIGAPCAVHQLYVPYR